MKATGILGVLLLVVGFVVFLGLMAFYHAFVLATLWAWFVVPLGVAKIGVAHAYGLSSIFSVILSTRGIYQPEDKRKEAVGAALAIPAFALLFGWIALGFM